MKTDAFIRQALEEWSAEAPAPAGLADRALRRRTRRRLTTTALALGSALLLAGAGVAVAVREGGEPPPVTRPVDTSLHTDTAHAPPRHFVAAGQVAISAYYISKVSTNNRGPRTITRTWFMYQPRSGDYQEVLWAWLDVAPGLRQAAVLAGRLPTSRVGILDMRTQKVTHWIQLNRPAGGVSWSPDGRKLLVTTYRTPLDLVGGSLGPPPDLGGPPTSGARTGFAVIDAKSRKVTYHALTSDAENPNIRQDFGWSRDGKLIWAPRMQAPAKVFYDLNGRPRPAPPHEADEQEEAGVSPNGHLQAVAGPPPGPNTVVKDLRTGKRVAVQPVEQANAWADDDHLIAVACPPVNCRGKGEFHNRYVLVSVDGKTIIPLTGYVKNSQEDGWAPVFTHR